MAKNDNILVIDSEKKVTPTEVLFMYLSYLPLFIVSLALCITASYIYVRYLVPKYKNNATILVKSDDKNGGSILSG